MGTVDDDCCEARDGKNGMLGEWSRDTAYLKKLAVDFQSAEPYPHVVIPNFFSEEIASRIDRAFPIPSGKSASSWRAQGWHVYDNPIEGKLALDNIDLMKRHDSIFSDMWEELQSIKLIDLLSGVTGIDGLENDPHLHGAGLHYHPRGSRLEMHLDYSIHPISKKERRLNLIVYMNRDWQEGWGGHLNLWEGTKDGMTRGPTQRIAPMFNQAVLFRTSDISWHGMPDAIECPEGRARKSVAIYYVSDPRQEATHRLKAMYQVRPDDPLRLSPDVKGYANLCALRVNRRLEPEDVAAEMPQWSARWPDEVKATN